MHSKCNLATPHRTGDRESAQTAAPRTPRTCTRMIKTPVPRMRMRSSAVRLSLSTPRSAFREDLDRFIPSRRRMNMDLCRRKLNSASNPPRESSLSVACAGSGTHHAADARVAKLAYEKELLSTLCNVPTSALDDDLQLKCMLQYCNVSPQKTANVNVNHHCRRRRPVVAADFFAMDILRSSTTCPIPKLNAAAARAIGSAPETILAIPLAKERMALMKNEDNRKQSEFEMRQKSMEWKENDEKRKANEERRKQQSHRESMLKQQVEELRLQRDSLVQEWKMTREEITSLRQLQLKTGEGSQMYQDCSQDIKALKTKLATIDEKTAELDNMMIETQSQSSVIIESQPF